MDLSEAARFAFLAIFSGIGCVPCFLEKKNLKMMSLDTEKTPHLPVSYIRDVC